MKRAKSVLWSERFFFFSIEWNRFLWNNWNELFETSYIKWVKLVLWNNLSLFLWHIPASWNKNIFIFKWVKLAFQIIETCISFNWNDSNQLYQMSEMCCLIQWVKSVFWNVWNKFLNEWYPSFWMGLNPSFENEWNMFIQMIENERNTRKKLCEIHIPVCEKWAKH